MKVSISHKIYYALPLFALIIGGYLYLNNIRITPSVSLSNTKASGPTLLQPSDFKYLGYYNIYNYGSETVYGQGFTHRYINGDLRFLTIAYAGGSGQLDEFSLAGKQYGETVSTLTNHWDSFKQLTGVWVGMWWDEPKQRLWTVGAVDYTPTVYPVQITTRTLNNNGTVSNVHGPIGIEGIPAKRVYGGCDAVPQSFQTQYGVGPYVCGWGGYTSLVAQGGGASMGGTMYAIPDPANYADNTEIPAGSFKTLMDHVGGSWNGDWYAAGVPTSYDRGTRITIPINYFDSGDNRPNGWCSGCNGDGPPTIPPAPSAQWLSPAPDGLGRWIWGDSYYNTGNWIDTGTKQGFVAIGNFDGGKAWYCASQFCSEKRQYELHIYDPAQFAQAIAGTRPAWNVQPASMTELTLYGLGTRGQGITGGVGGATYDPIGKKLYILGSWTDDGANRLYVYAVDDPTAVPGATPTPTPVPTATAIPTATAAPTAIPTATISGDVAQNATVTTSSVYNSTYAAARAIDGIIGINGTGEWASSGEQNPWIQLNWSSSQTINKIVFYDRINLTDIAAGGTLSFSDGTTVSVSGIPNDGTAKEVTFANKTVTWVKFQVVGGTGLNVGLSEIAVFNDTSASPTPTPTSTPVPLQGDLNHDGIVNSLDWSLMNSKWFTADTTADLNHDGIVNSLDFSLLNSHWLQTS